MALTQEKALEVINDLFSASTITKVLEKHGVRSKDFYLLINAVPSLSDEYSRAQHVRAELLADEIIDIADTAENPNHARNQIDVRKWAASKMRPDKYGERIDLNVNQTVDIRGALTEAQNRIRQVIETTAIVPLLPTDGISVENIPEDKTDLDKLLE